MRTTRKVSDALAMGLLLLAAALAAIAVADAGENKRLELVVAQDDGGEALVLRLDTAELGYEPFELVEGENRALMLDDGRSALMTRTADGLRIDVDGREIEIPAPSHAACAGEKACGDIEIEERITAISRSRNASSPVPSPARSATSWSEKRSERRRPGRKHPDGGPDREPSRRVMHLSGSGAPVAARRRWLPVRRPFSSRHGRGCG